MVAFKLAWQKVECYYDSLGNILFARYFLSNGKGRKVSIKHRKTINYLLKEGNSMIKFWERFPNKKPFN